MQFCHSANVDAECVWNQVKNLYVHNISFVTLKIHQSDDVIKLLFLCPVSISSVCQPHMISLMDQVTYVTWITIV